MKHRIYELLVLLILLPVLLLGACTQAVQKAPRETGSAPGTPPPLSASPDKPSAPPPAPTAWHSGVKTDYSGLTPYEPLKEKYTRLQSGPMTELQPSGNYGELLPYVGAALYGKAGYHSFNMYGLVTLNGMIVTDPVYAKAYRGSYYDYSAYTNNYVAAFDLEKLTDKIDMNNPWNSVRHAVCALDGSWVTKFDYVGVFFTDKVIMAIRDVAKNDIDILSYNGRLLYNTTALGCYDMIPPQSAYTFVSGYGEGLVAVPLKTGQTVYIDVMTHGELYTSYAYGEAFYGGYARIRNKENGPIGFINKDLNVFIKPQYLSADFFSGNRAVVQLQDGSYAVVDPAGNILFKNAGSISRWDANTYGVYTSGGMTRFYDSNFKEIATGGDMLNPLSGGWFYYRTSGGVVLQKGSEKYTLSGIKDISGVTGGLVYYYVNGGDRWSEGVKTLSGKDVVPLSEYTSIYLITSKWDEVYIVMTSYNKNGTNKSYKVLDKDGKTIMSGKGWAVYDQQYGLFEVNDEQSFGYVDFSGTYLFRISLMKYIPD